MYDIHFDFSYKSKLVSNYKVFPTHTKYHIVFMWYVSRGDGLHFNITCILCDVWYVSYPHVTNIQDHKKLPNQFESLFDKSQQLSRILKFTYLKLHPNYGYSLNFTQKSPVFYSQNIELSQNHPFAHFQSII